MVRAAAAGTLGVAVALLWAPSAMAEPEMPVDPSAPLAVVEPVPAGDPLAVPPAESVPPTAPAASAVALDDGVPHLPAPDALPPGTTQEKTRNSSTRGYLKDVWEAVRSGDVTTGEALLLIAQRPMDSKNVKQDMTPQQSTIPGAVPVPAAEALPPVPAAVPTAEAAPPAEAPLPDPAPPLPFTLAP